MYTHIFSRTLTEFIVWLYVCIYIYIYSYSFSTRQTQKMRHTAFLNMRYRSRPKPRHTRQLQKYLGSRWQFSKKGRPGRQVINQALPKQVRGWIGAHQRLKECRPSRVIRILGFPGTHVRRLLTDKSNRADQYESCWLYIYIYIYIYIRGSLNKFPDFFRMGTFIDSTHMKL